MGIPKRNSIVRSMEVILNTVRGPSTVRDMICLSGRKQGQVKVGGPGLTGLSGFNKGAENGNKLEMNCGLPEKKRLGRGENKKPLAVTSSLRREKKKGNLKGAQRTLYEERSKNHSTYQQGGCDRLSRSFPREGSPPSEPRRVDVGGKTWINDDLKDESRANRLSKKGGFPRTDFKGPWTGNRAASSETERSLFSAVRGGIKVDKTSREQRCSRHEVWGSRSGRHFL